MSADAHPKRGRQLVRLWYDAAWTMRGVTDEGCGTRSARRSWQLRIERQPF